MPAVNKKSSNADNENLAIAAFESASIGMALASVEGKWLQVNESLCKLTGYSRKEILKRTLADLTFPPDKDKDQKERQELIEGKRTSYQVEKRFINSSGHTIWVLLSVALVQGFEKDRHFVFQVENICDRKELAIASARSQEQLRMLFDQNPDPVFSLDAEGRFSSINNATAILAEGTPEQILGKYFGSFCDPEDVIRINRHLEQAQKGISFNFEIVITTLKSNRRYLAVTNMPLVTDGQVTGLYCIAKDVTVRHQARAAKGLAFRISRIFNSDCSLEECLHQSLEEICHFIDAPVAEAWVTLFNKDELSLYTQYFKGQPFVPSFKKKHEDRELPLLEKVKIRQQPIFIEDLATSKLFSRKEFVRTHRLHSAIAIPVLLEKDVSAALVFFTSPDKSLSRIFQVGEDLFIQLAADIDRKKMEDELNRFFNLSSDLLCVVDSEGYFQKLNVSFEQLTGINASEIKAKRFMDFVHPEDRAWMTQQIKKLAETNQNIHFENRLIASDSKTKWIDWTFTSMAGRELIYGIGRDVSKAKHLQKAFESEKQRFYDMFYQAPVTMAILKGEKHVFESANDLYYKFSGRTPDIIGSSVRDVFPEAEGQGIFELMDQVYRTGESYFIYERHLRLDVEGSGELNDIYLSFMFQPYKNSEGVVEGIFYFGVDVTEQVLVRKKVEESRKVYADLIQNLPAAVYTCDAKGYIQLYNRAAVSLWGRHPELGKDRWTGAWKNFDAQGKKISPAQTSMAKSLETQKPERGQEYQIQRPDGSCRHIVTFPSLEISTDGKLMGGVNVIIDITERKQKEEELKRLSLIARRTNNSVIITDVQGKIEWINEGFARLTGYSFDEAVGKKPVEILDGPKTDQGMIKWMDEKIANREPFECEILRYSKSKKPFWVLVQGQPIFDGNGKFTHYFELKTDITEKKLAYETLVKKEIEIRNFARELNDILEEERRKIAREIHDEFGQQLTGLKMSLSSLKNRPLNEQRHREIVMDMMEGVENTIRSLRSFSTELRPGILDTLGLVPSLEWLCGEFEKKSGLQCQFTAQIKKQEFSKNFSITIFRVCQEALTNVSKHAAATKVRVGLIQNRAKLSLIVKDNGKGIQTEKLHDPFSMGLIGMRERANLIGGQLEITNLNNKGTCVLLTANTNEN